MEEHFQCELCRQRHTVFYCSHCISEQIQHRKTMLAGLQADVAVLRKKTEYALQIRQSLVEEETKLSSCMLQVEKLTQNVMKTREKLCEERVQFVEKKSMYEQHSTQLEDVQMKLDEVIGKKNGLHGPLIQCLDLEIHWSNQRGAKVRARKIQQIFAVFGVNIELKNGLSVTHSSSRYFRSIAMLPLPISGRYESMPPEVVAAALGKIIHLLNSFIKYLKITYPHPMVFNGSFSTIGSTNEGAGCHTLYPDGSLGFQRGVDMLHENISFLCLSQGVPSEEIHATDLLGNLIKMAQSPFLGTSCEEFFPTQKPKTNIQSNSHNTTSHSSSNGESDTTQFRASSLEESAEILPQYSRSF